MFFIPNFIWLLISRFTMLFVAYLSYITACKPSCFRCCIVALSLLSSPQQKMINPASLTNLTWDGSRRISSLWTLIPKISAANACLIAIGTDWHLGSWYVGYLVVMPCVRNTTGYLFCLRRIIAQMSGLKEENTIFRSPPYSNTTFRIISRYMLRSNGWLSSNVPSWR